MFEAFKADTTSKLSEITSKLDQGCTACKEETTKQIAELEKKMNAMQLTQQKEDWSQVYTKNFVQNGEIVGTFNKAGTRQSTESWKYNSAIQPTSEVDDKSSFTSVSGGNGGWSTIGTRLSSNENGYAIINLKARYKSNEFVIWGWGKYSRVVTLWQYTKEDVPNFDDPSVINNESVWKMIGSPVTMNSDPSYYTTYKNANPLKNVDFHS